MRVFLIGYPGEMGGANTEAWHTIKLWRSFGLEVHLIPTWTCDARWKARVDALGCTTPTCCTAYLVVVPKRTVPTTFGTWRMATCPWC